MCYKAQGRCEIAIKMVFFFLTGLRIFSRILTDIRLSAFAELVLAYLTPKVKKKKKKNCNLTSTVFLITIKSHVCGRLRIKIMSSGRSSWFCHLFVRSATADDKRGKVTFREVLSLRPLVYFNFSLYLIDR